MGVNVIKVRPAAARTRVVARRPGESRVEGYLFILPALVVFGAFVLWPLTQGVWLSLWNWDGLSPATWAGVHNYTDIATDPELRGAFLHSVFLLLFWTVAPIVLGLFLAVQLSDKRTRGGRFVRSVLFLPQIVPVVAVG